MKEKLFGEIKFSPFLNKIQSLQISKRIKSLNSLAGTSKKVDFFSHSCVAFHRTLRIYTIYGMPASERKENYASQAVHSKHLMP